MALVPLGCRLEPLALLGSKPTQFHQAGHSALAAGHTLRTKLTVDAWTAIDTAILMVHGLDLPEELSVGHLPHAGRPLAPGVIAAGADIQYLAQLGYRELPPVIGDELEPGLLGCEKMATAFFRMSRS